MHLIRCRDQLPESLEEFYSGLAKNCDGILREDAEAMLSLLARLRAESDDRQVFGLTSHARLSLLAADDYRSEKYVVIAALGRLEFHVKYLMPAAAAPWPGAYVTGGTRSINEAIRMILIGMDNSQGWR
jgi:hypothetical protein